MQQLQELHAELLPRLRYLSLFCSEEVKSSEDLVEIDRLSEGKYEPQNLRRDIQSMIDLSKKYVKIL